MLPEESRAPVMVALYVVAAPSLASGWNDAVRVVAL